MDPLFFFHQGIDAADSPERFTPRYYASVGSVYYFFVLLYAVLALLYTGVVHSNE